MLGPVRPVWLLLVNVAIGIFGLAVGINLLSRPSSITSLSGGVLFCGIAMYVWAVVAVRFAQRRFPKGLQPARTTTYDGEPATFYPRWGAAGWVTVLGGVVLGGSLLLWSVLWAVVEHDPVTALLPLVPALYFLSLPVLWAVGWFRAGGVWITPTRVINEHYGYTETWMFANAPISPIPAEWMIFMSSSAASQLKRRAVGFGTRFKRGYIDVSEIEASAEDLSAAIQQRSNEIQGWSTV